MSGRDPGMSYVVLRQVRVFPDAVHESVPSEEYGTLPTGRLRLVDGCQTQSYWGFSHACARQR